MPPIRDIFRVKPRAATNNKAVVVKFHCQADRNRTLKAFADFRKSSHSPVTYTANGVETENFIYIHESLTPNIRKLVQLAVSLKRKKAIANAFTLRGTLYVRLKEGDEAVLIQSADHLKSLINTE